MKNKTPSCAGIKKFINAILNLEHVRVVTFCHGIQIDIYIVNVRIGILFTEY